MIAPDLDHRLRPRHDRRSGPAPTFYRLLGELTRRGSATTSELVVAVARARCSVLRALLPAWEVGVVRRERAGRSGWRWRLA